MHITDLAKMNDVIASTNLERPLQIYAREHPEIDAKMLETLERELRRYLEVRGTYTVKYGISGIVDEVLHSFILCTEQYTEFCKSAFGDYLHHSPQSEESDTVPVMYFRFLIDYVKHFREIPPNDIWPFSRELFGDTSNVEVSKGQCVAPCLVK